MTFHPRTKRKHRNVYFSLNYVSMIPLIIFLAISVHHVVLYFCLLRYIKQCWKTLLKEATVI